MPRVTVLMPTFKQASFIRRAIDSLLAQTLNDWELIILDDGSPDQTVELVQSYLEDARIQYRRWDENRGLGAALNAGLELSSSPYIAYLPSDDVYHADHLESLVGCLDDHPEAVLVYSGVRYNYNRYTESVVEGLGLQLVQVAHRWVDQRWMERSELVTDDLDRMYWQRLQPLGEFLPSGKVTAEWVSHPDQRHKRLREPEGGINPYRVYYGVQEPLRFHTRVGNYIDEVEHYRLFRERPDTPPAADGLKMLLVGELAYNPERVLALEEAGHQLYGLWMEDPYWYNYVGPLPFGHVRDLSRNSWQEEIRQIQPDVIYALLNWQAVPFAHHVLQNNPGVPFVWHFKEGPFISLEKGHWSQLVDLYQHSQGQIYTSPEMRDWFETILPGSVNLESTLILDGDLPKADWFNEPRSESIYERTGEIHTVVPGRPIGLHPHNVAQLAEQDIHLHFYGDFTHGQWLEWIEKTRRLAPRHIHLHSQVDQEGWVREFSQYDAGWLHFFQSRNGGDLRRADWDDLNYPARIATLAMAGLPLLQRSNPGSIVATQNLAQSMDIGLFFDDMEELNQQLRDRPRMDQLRANVWQLRSQFTFDAHVERLTAFFRHIIHQSQERNGSTPIQASTLQPEEHSKSTI
jgi:glycosyltransferase involved in cell wall biosynthesis